MNESQLKMSNIIHDIIHNEEEDVEEYYGIVVNVYRDIDKYLVQLDDIRDKIYLAQWCNNYDKVKELISTLSLSEYEKNKYLKLREKNIEIDETINFKILSEKYSFLDNIMDMITADSDIQDQILSLSDSRLKLFELMYSKLQTLTDYYNPYITTILQRIGYVSLDTSWKNKFHIYDDLLANIDDLMASGYILSNSEIEKLLYLCTSSVHHTVQNFGELQNFGDENTIDNIELRDGILKAKEEKDIDYLKFAILVQAYGISLQSAKNICKKYNISNIEITNENRDVFEMYMAIYQIINENDPDVLIQLYDEFTKIMKPEKDFRRIIVFENDLRKAFAHDLNNQVFKTDKLPYDEVDGIKTYDAGVDFKMIVTAIGAYQGNFENKENYSEYWNSPKIRSHGNCCSLIGNANLSMANVKNVIFGFSTMSDNMLLLSGSSDINSTPDSRNFNTTGNRSQEYMDANSMLNNTRGDYNELVYERRDLSSNPKFYKKNPDYIVFFEEYESYDEMFEKYKDKPNQLEYLRQQKELEDKFWLESLKAAKNFGIPIVKINREKVAKSEDEKIQKLVKDFTETKNPELLSIIITSFESSRVGNTESHAPIREKYFSSKKITIILDEIKNSINSIDNETERNTLYFRLYKAIIEEQRKVDACKHGKRNKHQTPGIDFTKELGEIEQILTNNNIDYSMVGRKK